MGDVASTRREKRIRCFQIGNAERLLAQIARTQYEPRGTLSHMRVVIVI